MQPIMTEQILFKGTPGIWGVTGGLLPQGLELNSATGEITGYPEEYGDFPIRVKFTNACGTVERDISVYTNRIITSVYVITDSYGVFPFDGNGTAISVNQI